MLLRPLRPLGLAALASAALAVAASGSARAQGGRLAPHPPDTLATAYGSTTALSLDLTEYGFGLGGSLRGALTRDLSAVAELHVGAGRDEREQQFFVGFFGDSVTPFKRNYVLLVPLHVGLERRLFRTRVEDNFRPFVHLTVGPTAAVQYPYFDDADRDGVRGPGEDRLGAFGGIDRAEGRLGVGGTLAVGAFFGRSRRTAQALRFGFTGHYFPTEVDLLELAPEVDRPSRHFFGTPVVTLHIARMIE